MESQLICGDMAGQGLGLPGQVTRDKAVGYLQATSARLPILTPGSPRWLSFSACIQRKCKQEGRKNIWLCGQELKLAFKIRKAAQFQVPFIQKARMQSSVLEGRCLGPVGGERMRLWGSLGTPSPAGTSAQGQRAVLGLGSVPPSQPGFFPALDLGS